MKAEDLEETAHYNYGITLGRVRGRLGNIRLLHSTPRRGSLWGRRTRCRVTCRCSPDHIRVTGRTLACGYGKPSTKRSPYGVQAAVGRDSGRFPGESRRASSVPPHLMLQREPPGGRGQREKRCP